MSLRLKSDSSQLSETVQMECLKKMKVFYNPQPEQDLPKGVCLTLGNFDGLHLGHRALLDLTQKEARQRGTASLLSTFDPHPAQVLAPLGKHFRLFSRKDLEQELEKSGLDFLAVDSFNRILSELTPREFITEKIWKRFQPKVIFVGNDFRFGKDRLGDEEALRSFGSEFGFEVRRMDPFEINGERVSTSLTKKSLATGNVIRTRELLGRPFYLEGRIVHGDGRGRTIGVPTANLEFKETCTPHQGVYLTLAEWLGHRYPAVTNVGQVPTFTSEWTARPRVETHVLDLSELNLYGQHFKVYFLDRIRDEKKFSSAEDLVEQIQKDILFAKSQFQSDEFKSIDHLWSFS